jgi:hypothetical protein
VAILLVLIAVVAAGGVGQDRPADLMRAATTLGEVTASAVVVQLTPR